MRTQQDPKRAHRTRPAPHHAPGIICACLVALEEAPQAGLPGLPRTTRGRFVGHVAQALKCLEGGVAAGRDVGGASL